MHNILWMYPMILMPLRERPPSRYGVIRRGPGGECYNGMLPYIMISEWSVILIVYYFKLILGAHAVLIEMFLIWAYRLPDLQSLYGLLFSSCVTIFCLIRILSRIPRSWVPSFGRVWSSPKAAYDRVWSAGSKAWNYVLGIVRGE